jgi:putative Ca2+/H+ antiporter (TMEM165/GDT1 family)
MGSPSWPWLYRFGAGTMRPPTSLEFWRTVAASFEIVFIAEWGDLTQVGTAALAAHYGAPITVVVAAPAALWMVAGIAVFLGNRAAGYSTPIGRSVSPFVVFGVVGIALLIIAITP